MGAWVRYLHSHRLFLAPYLFNTSIERYEIPYEIHSVEIHYEIYSVDGSRRSITRSIPSMELVRRDLLRHPSRRDPLRDPFRRDTRFITRPIPSQLWQPNRITDVLWVLENLRAPNIGGHRNLFCKNAMPPFGSHQAPLCFLASLLVEVGKDIGVLILPNIARRHALP